METVARRAALSGIALFLSCQVPTASAEPYVSVGIGLSGEGLSVGVGGVNHPTRCDRLLYADSASVPDDAACTDDSHRSFFRESLDLGSAFTGSANIGVDWGRFRVEAEFSSRSQDGVTRPAIAALGNAALSGKDSEWSPDSPPHYRLSDFKVHELFANVYYELGARGAWTPYVGVGAGFASVGANLFLSYQRRTLADGFVAAVGGDPAQPTEWQVAAAGTVSVLEAELDDRVFGYQLIVGAERALSEKTSVYAKGRLTAFEDLSSNEVWSTIRSHAPVQGDGVTPFRTDQTLEEMRSLAVTVGLKHSF